MASKLLLSIFLVLPALSAASLQDLLAKARSSHAANDDAETRALYDAAFEMALTKPSEKLSSVAVEISNFEMGQRHLPEAEAVLTRALDAEKRVTLKPHVVIPILMSLAQLYSQQRRYADLIQVKTQLVSAWEAQTAPDSVVVANNLHGLSTALQQAGRLIEAQQAMERSLTILRASYGVQAPCVVSSNKDLARIEKRLGAEATATEPQVGQKPRTDVTAPRVISKAEPQYSEAARKNHIQGTIVLFIVVDDNGNTDDPSVILPLGYGLDEKAIDAVSQWHFAPGMKDGKPVRVQATIEVNFRLL